MSAQVAEYHEDPRPPYLAPSAPTGVPRRRVADLGDLGFVVFAVGHDADLIRIFDFVRTG